MSKIQTALDRAKGGRADARGQSTSQAAASTFDARGKVAYRNTGLLDVNNLRRVNVDWETFKANRLLTQDPTVRHPAQGAYRMLRTRLMQSMRSNGWRVLGISSIGPDEGKTYTAINLAISIVAEMDQEAILVDLDLQRPSVYTQLGIDAGEFKSLSDYLEDGTQNLGDLLVSPGIERLGVLLSANPLQGSSDLLSSTRGKELFAELRGRMPPEAVIIVDLPPLLVADDALAVSPMLDALLLVVAEGQAERSDVAEARQMLQEFNLVGTVLNKSIEKDSKRAQYY